MRLAVILCFWFLAGLIGRDAYASQTDQSKTVIKIATVAPEGSAWMKQMRQTGQEINSQTQGRVSVKFFPGGVMGADDVVMRKIRLGQLQGGVLTASSLTQLVPDANVYSQPFLFENNNQAGAALTKGRGVLAQSFADKKLALLTQAGLGFAYLMSTQTVRSVDDLKKRKVWIPSNDLIGEMVIEEANVSPVTLPLGDVFTSLQTGMIDTVACTLSASIALQWHGKIKTVVDVPFAYVVVFVVVDQKTLDKMTAADKGTVRKAFAQAGANIERNNNNENQQARDALVKNGVTFVQLTPQEIAGWQAIGKKVRHKLAQQNTFGPQASAAVMAR